jgi:hypothetical protein
MKLQAFFELTPSVNIEPEVNKMPFSVKKMKISAGKS